MSIKSLPQNNSTHCHKKEKTIIIWRAKAACTSVNKMIFHHEGLLDEALKYSPWIHDYRMYVYKQSKMSNHQHKFIHFTVNPYQRAVSSYLHEVSCNLMQNEMHMTFSFRKYINDVSKKIIKPNPHHNQQTYSKHKCYKIDYIKMEHIDDKFDYIKNKYSLNYIKTSSPHHKKLKAQSSTEFVGDVGYDKLIIPTNYALFYDDNIKNIVDKLYADDIKYLGYTWNEFVDSQSK